MPIDAQEVKGRLLQMESEFRSGRQQQQAAAAAGNKERGAGDWTDYQPPSAVLQALHQKQAAQQAQQPAAPAAAPAEGAKRELPPALRARLAARGILPKEEGNTPASSAAASLAAASEGPLPPGWYQATDPQYKSVYYYCPATGERSWTRPKAAVSWRVAWSRRRRCWKQRCMHSCACTFAGGAGGPAA